jgi:hypothetical protein
MVKKSFFSEDVSNSVSAVPSARGHEKFNDLEKAKKGVSLRLGIWDHFQLSRRTSELTKEKLEEITQAELEKQKSEIVHRLMLDLDLSKKSAFKEYMDNVGILNAEVIASSSALERELRNTLRQEIYGIIMEKNSWEKQIMDYQRDGILVGKDFDQEIERMEEWMEIAKGNIDGKVRLTIKEHIKSLETTLKLLKDKMIGGDAAL